MISLKSASLLAAAAALAGVIATPSVAQTPDAHIHFHGGSVAFIAGVGWGSGAIDYHGKHVALRVNGLSVGAIGANSYEADGVVFHLHHLRDIEGTYAAVDASATAGAGAGEIDMKNGNGVEIVAHSSSHGLKLSMAGSGVDIRLK
ncbi:MAG TPA: hypothetical protein VGL58_08645 [Caulobacteraceae bacterium]|jgi:hypothetical protein